MQEEVLEFIDFRWKDSNAHWLDGNCYWFAHILCTRFPYLKIIYLPVQGHFVAGDIEKNIFFDWTGKVHVQEVPMYLDWIKEHDELWYDHIKRDCIN